MGAARRSHPSRRRFRPRAARREEAPASPGELGNAVMNAAAAKGGVAPVAFSHWLHRRRLTCRLRQVDIGLAMEANGTGMKEDDDRRGRYCGPFPRSQGKRSRGRCRSRRPPPACRTDASGTTSTVRRPSGKARKLVDLLPGVSVRRKPLDVPKDYDSEAKMPGLTRDGTARTRSTRRASCARRRSPARAAPRTFGEPTGCPVRERGRLVCGYRHRKRDTGCRPRKELRAPGARHQADAKGRVEFRAAVGLSARRVREVARLRELPPFGSST